MIAQLMKQSIKYFLVGLALISLAIGFWPHIGTIVTCVLTIWIVTLDAVGRAMIAFCAICTWVVALLVGIVEIARRRYGR